MRAGVQLHLREERAGSLSPRGLQSLQLVHQVPPQGVPNPKPCQDLHTLCLAPGFHLSHSRGRLPQNILQDRTSPRPQVKTCGDSPFPS